VEEKEKVVDISLRAPLHMGFAYITNILTVYKLARNNIYPSTKLFKELIVDAFFSSLLLFWMWVVAVSKLDACVNSDEQRVA
jgi:hypothetical protein